ncbi:Glucose-repressible protein [Fusarium oxysporum f. sp. cubense race 1]|uniref:Glucose-repressible protein n=1 Tax=Fusarium oxysporum f. sp. cubense (strain race 1) TaxID=1229664 RepID=N4TWM0_FUSC1|nr:Glucose-repressible protein [Fusarium oxysporum f. sp. cubense race 1]
MDFPILAMTYKFQQATSGASKEANKEVAKDGNVPISTRATAAKDALGDKIDETTHDKKADVSSP